jgi:hypothetical protein
MKEIEQHNIEYELGVYAHSKEFALAMREQGHISADILDLNFLFAALIGALHIQSRLDEIANRKGSFFVKAQLLNVWRHRPFLDVAKVISEQRKHGVPVCMHADILAPPGDEPDDFKEVPTLDDVEDPKIRKFVQAMYVFEPIAAAVGIETGLARMAEDNPNDEAPYIYPELINACTRANEAQRLRNLRRSQ